MEEQIIQIKANTLLILLIQLLRKMQYRVQRNFHFFLRGHIIPVYPTTSDENLTNEELLQLGYLK